jgi:hypothetical protein
MTKRPLEAREIEVLARISVLEYLVAHLFNMQYGEKGVTLDQAKEEHRKAKALFKRQTFPQFDPAHSDLIAGEMERALTPKLEVLTNPQIRTLPRATAT